MEVWKLQQLEPLNAMKQVSSGKQSMRTFAKLILAAVLLLVAGCSSKLEKQLLTCADFESAQITIDTAVNRLGLTSKHTTTMSEMEIVDEYCDVLD